MVFELIGAIAGAGSFVLDAVKFSAAPIGRPFKYLYNYDTNFRNLEKEVTTLKNTSDDVQVKVTDAEVNVEEIKQSVKDWQTMVNNTITEAERLIQEKEDSPGCFKGFRPNCITRYKHSKKAFKLKQDIVLKQEEKFDRVSYPTIPLEKNFDKLRDDVLKLRNARGKVQRKVEEAKNNVEETEEDVKKWLEDVDSIIVKAEDLIKSQSSIGTDRETRCQKSKAASELMEDKIDPLLQQEVKFDRVSYPTIPLEKNFDKLRDDVSKLTNARRKVQRKVEEAKNNEEEIEEDVKKWLEDVDSIIVKADDLIKNQSSIGTDHKTRYQKSKAASELMEDKIDPLLQQEVKFDRVSYPTIPLEKNFDKLRDDVSKLKNARLKVQCKITEAKNNVEEITEDVNKWLEDVDSIIIKAEELIENQSSISTDWETRYRNSKAASELMVDNIAPLLQQEERFDKVSRPSIHKEIWLRCNEDYLAFESRNSTEKNVWEALKDEKIYMMGVYGMGGLGKTTLVQEIGRKADNDKLFDDIVFVEVTETPDTKKIQTVIANKLGLKFEDAREDGSQRASKLYSRMEKRNILLIIDNIWEELDLKIVGIPSLADRGRNKILMTTRNVDVLERMGSTKNLGMGILNEEEAWRLFQKMAGNVIQIPGLNSLPNDVCKECGGLPIVICTIAKALRNRRQKSQWEDALLILRTPSPAKFTRLLEKEYSKIKLSYDYLEDDELKKTFIILSLMENNTSILDLLKNIVGLGILDGANLTIEQARNRLDSVVKELKDSCLLLDGGAEGRFSMHDVVRIVALTCAYTDHHVFTERNDIEREWKDKDKLRTCTIVSLVGNNIITQLWPEALDCPKLEFLRVSSFEIPNEFFTVMPKLKVLNLFGIQQSLPSSLDLLTNLQTLCLDDSTIEDVTIIGKLKKLKVLSLRNTYIKELSIEMGQLTELKILDLSNCWYLEVIAPNVISKLSQLEELYTKGCSIYWDVEVLKELKHLSQLTSLKIDIEDKKMMPEDFLSRELKRCNISIGSEWSNLDDRHEFSRILEFQYHCTISLEELRILKNVEFLWLVEFLHHDNSLKPLFNEKVIFTNLQALTLEKISFGKIWDNQFPTLMSSSYQNLTSLILWGCREIKYVFPSSIAKSLQTLQHLEIMHCAVLEEIVAEEEGAKDVNFAFPQVTFLKLQNLPELVAFYPGIHTCALSMLKRLEIEECEKFTSKYLSFQENSFHIPKPKSLCLEHKINFELEELKLKIKETQITWRSQFKNLQIEKDESTNIPLGLVQRFENLEVLQLAWCRYEEMFSCGKDKNHIQITPGPSLAFFQNLQVLNVSQCRELMKLMTPSMARSLVQLRELNVEACETMIEIVENEGDVTTSTEIVFDNLKKLLFRRLENLICFCSGNYSFNYPSLEELIIEECPNMKTFSQGIVSTPKLHKVNYESWYKTNWMWKKIKEVENEGNDINKSIKGVYKKQDISLDLKYKAFKDVNSIEICYNQHPNFFYQNLTHLFLWNCGNIKYAFPSSIAKSLHQLQQLKIENCEVLEEIVAKEEGANAVVDFVFPNITFLKLQNLPKLTTFYLGIHTSKWPMLKELVVINCEKFTSKYMSFQENGEEGELHISEPNSLFLDDKINQDLEVFNLKNGKKKIIWQSHSQVLKISHDNSTNIPLRLLQRFESPIKFSCKCDQYQQLFFPNLLNLEVLCVHGCRNLMKLITPSTARNLVQLREMRVENCEMLIEIVENEGEGDATRSIEIVFDNLKKLSLGGLESLTCFCSGNYSFNFPSLEELKIGYCPNMKSFSQGILSIPKLYKVDCGIWFKNEHDLRKKWEIEIEGNELNRTIQQAIKELNYSLWE